MKRILPALALALVTGCGTQAAGSGVASVTGASASATPTASSTADQLEQGRKFAQCMRDNGVQMEDPDPSQGLGGKLSDVDRDSAPFKKAFQACREIAPFNDRARELTPEQLEQMRDFAACMRENGVEMPDPDPQGGFLAQMGKIKPDDPQVKKALEACNDKLGSLRGRK